MTAYLDSGRSSARSKTKESGGLNLLGCSARPTRDQENSTRRGSSENRKDLNELAKKDTGLTSSVTGMTYQDKVRLFNLLENIKQELRNMNKYLRHATGDWGKK